MNGVSWLLAVFISSAIMLFALLYWFTRGYLVHQVDERLHGEVAEFHWIGRSAAITDITSLSRRDVARSRPYGLFDTDGTWLAGNIQTLPAVPAGEPFDYTVPLRDGNRLVEGHFRGIIVPTLSGLRIVVGHSTDEIIGFNQAWIRMLCAGLALTILLGLGCGAALKEMSNRRIRELSVTASEIMSGKLGQRLPTRGDHHDLDRLAEIVNTMLGEIERLVAEVRDVCAGIAHDLRTPMTHLRAGLERVRRRASRSSDYEEAIDAAIEQSDVVLNRFMALLRIAEIDASERKASFSEIALNTVLRDVVELYEPVGEDRGLSIVIHTPVTVMVRGDIDLLFGAIENLLDNALKFTPRGGAITLQTGYDEDVPVLQVADAGPGIDIGERRAVLRPFYRTATRQAHAVAGHGLGLSLVAAIARVHDADIEIHDNHPGCRIVLRFRGSPRSARV